MKPILQSLHIFSPYNLAGRWTTPIPTPRQVVEHVKLEAQRLEPFAYSVKAGGGGVYCVEPKVTQSRLSAPLVPCWAHVARLENRPLPGQESYDGSALVVIWFANRRTTTPPSISMAIWEKHAIGFIH